MDIHKWALFVEKLTKETLDDKIEWFQYPEIGDTLNEKRFFTGITGPGGTWTIRITWHPGMDESVHNRQTASIEILGDKLVSSPWKVPYSGEHLADVINDKVVARVESVRDCFLEK